MFDNVYLVTSDGTRLLEPTDKVDITTRFSVCRDLLDVGQALKAMRLEAGLTQLEVSERLGYASSATVCQYETNRREPPLTTFIKMINLYGRELAILEVEDEK